MKTAWLLETTITDPQGFTQIVYYRGHSLRRFPYTSDANEAHQFNSKDDAETFATGELSHNYKAVEHGWPE